MATHIKGLRKKCVDAKEGRKKAKKDLDFQKYKLKDAKEYVMLYKEGVATAKAQVHAKIKMFCMSK
tara:strand:- start:421 stop:618 length:198 start_codon:yes stop_codon:yes gene_type:complete